MAAQSPPLAVLPFRFGRAALSHKHLFQALQNKATGQFQCHQKDPRCFCLGRQVQHQGNPRDRLGQRNQAYLVVTDHAADLAIDRVGPRRDELRDLGRKRVAFAAKRDRATPLDIFGGLGPVADPCKGRTLPSHVGLEAGEIHEMGPDQCLWCVQIP